MIGRRTLTILAVLLAVSVIQAQTIDSLFELRAEYSTGSRPESVCAADLDQDEDIDLAVACGGPLYDDGMDSVSVLLNNGDGTFEAAENYASGNGPYSIVSADLDFDGDIDLAVLNRAAGTVSVLKNYGYGTFELPHSFLVGDIPTDLSVSDLDGDGDRDLVTSNMWNANVSILRNKGYGSFYPALTSAAGTGPMSVFAADLNGDHKNDLAVAINANEGLAILLNNGNATFQMPVFYSGGGNPHAITGVDFNGDSAIDLAVANNSSGNVFVYHNHGNATFSKATQIGTNPGPNSICSADFDRDGDKDLATGSDGVIGTISIFLNGGGFTFQLEHHYAAGSRTGSVFAADLDNDNDDDLIAANRNSNSISIFSNRIYVTDAAMEPTWLAARDAYAPEPADGALYVGDPEDGHAVDEIDPFSVSINGIVSPHSFVLINDHPDIPGEVLKMSFDLRDLAASYGAVWGTTIQIYSVMGNYLDGTHFGAGGNIEVVGFRAGDANCDQGVDVGDIYWIAQYVYNNGPGPKPMESGDVNADGSADATDAVYLINYIFKNGPPPSHP
jgi:hypothetical protein